MYVPNELMTVILAGKCFGPNYKHEHFMIVQLIHFIMKLFLIFIYPLTIALSRDK